MLYVITGARGAGKTTLINNIRDGGIGVVLQPSTTRLPRFDGETEYDFVSVWEHEKYAWTIQVGDSHYGMRKSEIERALEAPSFTVFDPTSIETFYEYRRRTGIDALTIGLDTIRDLNEQHVRVNMSPSRMMTAEQLEVARQRVRQTDLCIAGDEDEIVVKIKALVQRNRS